MMWDKERVTGLRCITLWQPWAQWVALGWKEIETRRHGRFAGLVGQRIGIHAARRWDDTAVVAARRWLSPERARITEVMRAEYPAKSGRVLCTAFVEEFRLLGAADEGGALIECGTRRYGLLLCEVEVLGEPVFAQGRQGIWRVQTGLDEAAEARRRKRRGRYWPGSTDGEGKSIFS